jgi:hypothetical protein
VTLRISVSPLSAVRVARRGLPARSMTQPEILSLFFRSSFRSPVEIFTS